MPKPDTNISAVNNQVHDLDRPYRPGIVNGQKIPKYKYKYFQSSGSMNASSTFSIPPKIEPKTIEWRFLRKKPVIAIILMSSKPQLSSTWGERYACPCSITMTFVPCGGLDCLCSKIPTMLSSCGPGMVTVVGAMTMRRPGGLNKGKYDRVPRCGKELPGKSTNLNL